MSEVRFPVEMAGGVPVVRTPEEIDITNASEFREALLLCAERGTGITVVDMTRTRFCDSAGLHVVVAAHKRTKASGGELRLVTPGPNLLRVFAISGLDRAIPCYRDLGRALAELHPSRPAAPSSELSSPLARAPVLSKAG